MNDVPVMQVLDSAACLDDESSNFRHGEIFSFSNDVRQRSIFAYLEDHVCILFEGECTIEFDDVWVMKLGV